MTTGCATTTGDHSHGPVVRTREGRLRGFFRNGAEIYLGVPYGASTAGDRRFLPPAPAAPWSGIRDATRLGQRAPQGGRGIYYNEQIGPYMTGGRQQEIIQLNEPMGEDCLVLNVLTPASGRADRPVMVYFHGGGFASGSGAVLTASDRFVIEHDTVVVTVNHRLGALGFAYLGALSERYRIGNPGMLDLVASLRWVRDNIPAFGGDPAKVTVFGESGGAAKVGLLMSMPQASGLFRAAIMESGMLPNAEPTAAADAGLRMFMQQQNLPDVAALASAPSEAFVRLRSGPVADGLTLSADPWREAPAAAAALPLLLGHCADEATLFGDASRPQLFSLQWDQVAPELATTTHASETALAPAIGAYRAAYSNANASDIYFRMASQALFGRGMRTVAARKALQAPPVYFYRFDYDTGIAPGLRAFHTAELPLAMRMVQQEAAQELSRRVAGAWANFARFGDPNGSGGRQWPRYGGDGRTTFVFEQTRSRLETTAEADAEATLMAALPS